MQTTNPGAQDVTGISSVSGPLKGSGVLPAGTFHGLRSPNQRNQAPGVIFTPYYGDIFLHTTVKVTRNILLLLSSNKKTHKPSCFLPPCPLPRLTPASPFSGNLPSPTPILRSRSGSQVCAVCPHPDGRLFQTGPLGFSFLENGIRTGRQLVSLAASVILKTGGLREDHVYHED